MTYRLHRKVYGVDTLSILWEEYGTDFPIQDITDTHVYLPNKPTEEQIDLFNECGINWRKVKQKSSSPSMPTTN